MTFAEATNAINLIYKQCTEDKLYPLYVQMLPHMKKYITFDEFIGIKSPEKIQEESKPVEEIYSDVDRFLGGLKPIKRKGVK